MIRSTTFDKPLLLAQFLSSSLNDLKMLDSSLDSTYSYIPTEIGISIPNFVGQIIFTDI
jgi:hypothetical protein